MDDEVYRFKMMLACGILFLVSAVMSYRELQYMMSGETAQATLIRTETSRSRRHGRPYPTLVVEYQFADARGGGVRKESDRVPTDWPIDRGTTQIAVEYIPGSPGWSRLHGHSQMVWVYLFGACLLAIGYFFYKFWKFYKS